MVSLIENIYYNPTIGARKKSLSMAWADIPDLSLVLRPEVNGLKKSVAVALNPGDAIYGRLDITCKTSFHVRNASIFLEGISRNWVSTVVKNQILLDITKAERKFLSQTLDIPTSDISEAVVASKGFHTSIPFYFIVSNKIPSSDPQSPEHCLQLPPSIELGSVMVDDETGKRFAQPSISYALRAAVCFSGRTDYETTPPIESSLALILRPRTKEFPPTDTLDFPAEFKLRISKSIRWSMFARNLGTMTVSVQEPRPLTYDASSTGSLTECHIELELLAADSEHVQQALQAMKISINSLVRAKTFYSVKSFSQLPSQTLLSSDKKTRLRDEFLKLEPRNIPQVSWRYEYYSAEIGSGGESMPANKRSTTESIELDTGLSSCSEPASLSQAPSGRWTAKFTHPIRIQSRVLPTFCSSIVARLYTVIVRLKVSGIRRESFDLEVPLQVVHTSSNGASDEEYPVYGTLEEDPTSLDFRRASMASWFSNESIDPIDKPPHYHP